MNRIYLCLLFCVVALSVGCGDDGTDTNSAMDSQVSRPFADQYVAPISDMGQTTDQSINAIDMGMLPPVTDCDSLCDRLSLCGNGALGGSAVCPDRCAEIESLPDFSAYLSCVDNAECDRLNSCRVPEEPPPTCDEVCTALDTCEPEPQLPEALEDVSTCADMCTADDRASAMVICGRAYAEGSTMCDGDTFSRCLAEQLYPICTAVCDQKISCETEMDFIACLADCAAPSAETDPVTRRRARLRQTCWQTAPDCDTARQCDVPSETPIVDPTALCAADVSCDLIDAPCEETVSGLSQHLGSETINCVATKLNEACDADLTGCFIGPTLDPLGCDEYCAVGMLCEELPAGQTEFDCIANCRGAIESEDEVQLNRFRRPVACAFANTCADFTACLNQGGGADICTAACDHIRNCATADVAETCVDICNNANTLRQEIFFGCNALVDTCSSANAQCTVPNPPNCSTICAGSVACGLVDEQCERRCDDDAYLTPEAFLEQYACHGVARNCPDREQCLAENYAAGRACLNHCRQVSECNGAQATMLSCLDDCSSGLSGETGLMFEMNYACLSELPADASCASIGDCEMNATPAAICATVCEAQGECLLFADGVDRESCEAACLVDLETNPDAYACALRAGRVANGCFDLATCLGIEVEPAAPACVTQCEARAQCDASTDQFICEQQCQPDVAGTDVRLACLDMYSECDTVLACLDNPTADPSLCMEICGKLEQCDGELGPDGRYPDRTECQNACNLDALIDEAADYSEVNDCLDEAACVSEDIEACFSGGLAAPTCDNAWTAYEACGNDMSFFWILVSVTDRASYLNFCNDLIAMEGLAVVERRIACVIEAAALMMCDDQLLGCSTL